MQKLNLRTQKLNFPGTHWRGLALIGAQKKPLIMLENDQKQACCYLKGQARCQWPICRPRRQPRSTEGF